MVLGLISCGLQVFVTISLIVYQLFHVREDEKNYILLRSQNQLICIILDLVVKADFI